MNVRYELRTKSNSLEPKTYGGRHELTTKAETENGVFRTLVKAAEREFERYKKSRAEMEGTWIANMENHQPDDVFEFTSSYTDGMHGMAYRFALLCRYDREFDTDNCSFRFESAR